MCIDRVRLKVCWESSQEQLVEDVAMIYSDIGRDLVKPPVGQRLGCEIELPQSATTSLLHVAQEVANTTQTPAFLMDFRYAYRVESIPTHQGHSIRENST